MTTCASSSSSETTPPKLAKPAWLKVRPPSGERYHWIKDQTQHTGVATVCQEARCPNMGECWTVGTATFMIMGDICTRGCRFCAVKTGNPNGRLDTEEPTKLATTIAQAGWEYVVITSVDRDDLPDGGAAHFAQCIVEVKKQSPNTLVEVLIPDFKGEKTHLQLVIDAKPDVIAQNIETVERLTHPVRDRRAGYRQTMDVLAHIKSVAPHIITKSSIMLGLGETAEELRQTMADLRTSNVQILTLGQYLQPTPKHLAVEEYITPEAFDAWRIAAEEQYGFLFCASGPLVRSSYRAGEFFMTRLLKGERTAIKSGLG